MASSSSSPASAASTLSVSIDSHNNSLLDWRKMNKQELRDALASRGLDTNGLRPSLIQRLQTSSKNSAEIPKETGKSTGTGTRPGTEARTGKDAEKPESETRATIISSQDGLVSQADAHRSNFDSSKNSEKQDLSANVSSSRIGTVSKEAILSDQEKNLIPTFQQKKERTSIISHCQAEMQSTQENRMSSIQKEEKNGNSQDIVNVTGDKQIVSKEPSKTDLDVSLKDSSSDSNLAKNGFAKKNFVLNVSSGSSIASLSDLDKKRVRAERFGMGLKMSEKEKLAIRAERFAGAQGKDTCVQGQESEKRKQRAARFGITEEPTKKKARLERFGTTIKQMQ